MKIGYLAATIDFRTETKKNGLISRTKAFLSKLATQQSAAAAKQEPSLRQPFAGNKKQVTNNAEAEHPYSTYEVHSSEWAAEYNNP